LTALAVFSVADEASLAILKPFGYLPEPGPPWEIVSSSLSSCPRTNFFRRADFDGVLDLL